MTPDTSRGLVRATLIMGGAQFTTVLVSIIRMKVIALLLGPAGVGLFGMYGNLLETITVVAGLGMNTSGIREVVKTKSDGNALSATRLILFISLFVQGAIAMLAMWRLRRHLANWIFGNTLHATEVGLIGVAVFFTMLAVSQVTLLQGLRRVGDIGRATVASAGLGTIAGLLAVWLKRDDGLIWYLIIQPAVAAATTFYFARKIPRSAPHTPTLTSALGIWRTMAAIGTVFMLAGLAYNLTVLLARALIAREFDLHAVGFLAASWSISIQSVSFLFSAMAADYYPRLSEVITTPQIASRLINEQIQLSLALTGPLLLLLIGLAPWIMNLLYTPDFQAAVPLLQWQTTGNVLRLSSLPINLAFVAAARMKTYLAAEVFLNALFLILLCIGLPHLGFLSAGPAFLVSYIAYICILTVAARIALSFRWEKLSLWLVGCHAAFAATLLFVSAYSPLTAALCSICLAIVTGIAGIRIVVHKIGPGNRVIDYVATIFAAMGWPLPLSQPIP